MGTEHLIVLIAGANHDGTEDNPDEATFGLLEREFGEEADDRCDRASWFGESAEAFQASDTRSHRDGAGISEQCFDERRSSTTASDS